MSNEQKVEVVHFYKGKRRIKRDFSSLCQKQRIKFSNEQKFGDGPYIKWLNQKPANGTTSIFRTTCKSCIRVIIEKLEKDLSIVYRNFHGEAAKDYPVHDHADGVV